MPWFTCQHVGGHSECHMNFLYSTEDILRCYYEIIPSNLSPPIKRKTVISFVPVLFQFIFDERQWLEHFWTGFFTLIIITFEPEPLDSTNNGYIIYILYLKIKESNFAEKKWRKWCTVLLFLTVWLISSSSHRFFWYWNTKKKKVLIKS